MDPGRCQVVFCRNVLIYYRDPAARRAVLDTFHERLAPGGWLLFGYSEVPLDGDERFEAVHLEGALVYRKRGRRAAPAPVPTPWPST